MLIRKLDKACRNNLLFPGACCLRNGSTKTSVSCGTLQRLPTLSETLHSVLDAYKSRPFMSTYVAENDSLGNWRTYGEFYASAVHLGNRLIREHGLKVGDRVGVCTHNCEEWFIIEHACALYGFVSVSLPNTSPQNIVSMVKDFSIKIVFSCLKFSLPDASSSPITLLDPLEWCQTLEASTQSENTTDTDTSTSAPLIPPPLLPDELLHTIILTGGSSTGRPKGVKYSRGMWNADMVPYPSSSLRAVSYLPTSHIVDRHHVSVTMFNGGEVVVVNSLDLVFKALATINPTILFITPAMCGPLFRAKSVGACLRVLVCVAGGISAETAASLRNKWKVGSVVNPYGLTDIGNIAIDGRLLDNVVYKILPVLKDGEDEGSEVARESTGGGILRGELLVKTRFEGYVNHATSDSSGCHNNSTSSSCVMDCDGYFYTGDLVEINSISRSIVVYGRVNEQVKMPNGEWVLPSQVESAVEHHASQTEQFPISDIFVEARAGSSTVCAIVHVAGHPSHEVTDTATASTTYLLNCVLRHAGLAARVTEVIFSSEPFTVQNQLRNHSLKLNRHKIRLKFSEELNDVFENNSMIICGDGVSGHGDAARSNISSRVAECIANNNNRGDGLSNMTFRELGGDSLSALQVKHLLKTEHGISDDRVVSALLNVRYTLRDVKTVLKSAAPQTYVRDAFMEKIAYNLSVCKPSCKLSQVEDIKQHFTDEVEDTMVVLVTGAGGIIGRHVAAELANRQKSLRVVCLVRKVSRSDVEDMFQDFDQLEVVTGDVSLPMMGMDESVFRALTASVQHVFHCAGNTNQSLHFEDLASNLSSTAEVLLFASLCPRLRSTTLLSTTDVLAPAAPESLPLQSGETRHRDEMNGYTRMKLHEESIAHAAATAGLSGITLCRLGLVCNSSKPWPQKHDFIDILFRGMMEVGASPEIAGDVFVPPLLPADVAANWIVSLTLNYPSVEEQENEKAEKQQQHIIPQGCKVYHLFNPDDKKVSYKEAFRDLSLPLMPYYEWVPRVSAGSPLHQLLRQVGGESEGYSSTPTLFRSNHHSPPTSTTTPPCHVGSRGKCLVMTQTNKALQCLSIATAPPVKTLVQNVIANARASVSGS